MKQLNATQKFLGNETQWPTAKVELYDVQGLWGGRRIIIEGANRVIVQRVDRGMQERRYEFVLGQDDLSRLLNLFIENDFLTIQPAERMGIPDEARPRIILVNEGGEKRELSKWARVTDERFDALYKALLHFEKLTENMEPVYKGRYEFGT